TSAEKPGSAISASGTPLTGKTWAVAVGSAPCSARGQFTRRIPSWSTISGSVTLSIRIVISTRSTDSSATWFIARSSSRRRGLPIISQTGDERGLPQREPVAVAVERDPDRVDDLEAQLAAVLEVAKADERPAAVALLHERGGEQHRLGRERLRSGDVPR